MDDCFELALAPSNNMVSEVAIRKSHCHLNGCEYAEKPACHWFCTIYLRLVWSQGMSIGIYLHIKSEMIPTGNPRWRMHDNGMTDSVRFRP